MIHKLLKYHAIMASMLLVAAPASAQSSNEAAVREVQARQEQAWNEHDPVAYAQLFADDANVINVLGWHWKGRAEVERKLASAFSFVFAKSKLDIEDVSIRPLSDRLALAYVTWSMTGAVSPDGSGGNIPQRGIQTQLLEKVDGRWLILSFQNTNAVPERPFPMAATPSRASPAKPAETESRGCWVATRNGDCLIRKGRKQ